MPSVLGERATVRVIHVLRKPLSEGTVASNVLKHGCGGLNIDASRIGTSDYCGGGSKMSSSGHTLSEFESYEKGSGWVAGSVSGRWPANLILQHLDGCRCEGVKKVKAHNPGNKATRGGASTGECYGDYGKRSLVGHADEDGKESVANWICVEGCPVAALDEQSGVRAKGNFPSQQNTTTGIRSSKGKSLTPEIDYGDSGGASRFSKQIGGEK